ncbi:hypothetical protein UFOVP1290_535 [uncultured Caudovirales phage]|uniref:Uncharacterized protein n=1 Tax=uncultured Caudovirales phage TaxID=2100421 RepID=A0A6J5RXN6_9CAUD|nr:hypothetical protein UFOVP1290_535 [uncultured Caudovirales phage]
MHFEELWEQGEKINENGCTECSASSIINELLIKIELYKNIDSKSDIDLKDIREMKSKIFGEILLTLTHLSLKDDINVFTSLHDAIKIRSISFFSSKYKS